ncbi:MAG: geranylgeranyl pyrophosphate synthase [Candidatus Peregrinibacteria bacterium Greene0416_19]|nr:MAG: geranylgeranyl pyrophosphate synthase [Candidatus Peregrinibacteria bacterium Greene0416_19]
MPDAFATFASRWLPDIESALDRLSASNDTLRQAMRYSLLLPGKRIRPLLVLAACEVCGGRPEAALPAAASVEMVHCFSLIHDDLPAMDDDDLRRGKPTNHKVYGDAQAILAGDALLALAFDVLAKNLPTDVAARCCGELASASVQMAEGQSIDIRGFDHPASQVELEHLHRLKTGVLIVCALRMGGIVAGAGDSQLEALMEYGWRVGLAFQIMDDLLDVTGDEAKAGKKLGKDAGKGKQTFPALLGVEGSRGYAERLIEEARGYCKALEQSDVLMGLAGSVVGREW